MSVVPVAGAAASGNAPTWPFDIPQPTNLQAGDLMLISFTSGSALGTITAPTGWSQSSLGSASNSTIFFQVWWKLAGGSEPASYHWLAANNTVPVQYTITVFRGVDQTTPIDTAWVTTTGTTTPDTAPAITVVTSNAMVLSQLVSVNNIHWTAPSTSPATTLYLSTGGGDDIFTQSPLNSGALAARTFTPSGTRGRWIGVSIALRPTSGTAHTGLTGSGSITISQPAAIQVTLTGLGANNGSGKGNPTPYYNLGNIAWGTANGAMRNYFLQHSTELILAPIADATVVYYRFGTGITGAITELSAP